MFDDSLSHPLTAAPLKRKLAKSRRPPAERFRAIASAAPLKQDCMRDADSRDRKGDREVAAQRVLRARAAFARAPCPGMGPSDRGRCRERKTPRGLRAG